MLIAGRLRLEDRAGARKAERMRVDIENAHRRKPHDPTQSKLDGSQPNPKRWRQATRTVALRSRFKRAAAEMLCNFTLSRPWESGHCAEKNPVTEQASLLPPLAKRSRTAGFPVPSRSITPFTSVALTGNCNERLLLLLEPSYWRYQMCELS